jgi:sensor domain CHASE-containing protein
MHYGPEVFVAFLRKNLSSMIRWQTPWLIAGITLLLGVLISIKLAIRDAWQNVDVDRSRATIELAATRARLDAVVNSVFSATSGIVSVISHQGEISPALFDSMAAQSIKINPSIRNIAIAPDNIISRIFPLAGNERALGLNYRTIPEQYKTVQQAMQSGRPKLGGPFNLVQGGGRLYPACPGVY